MKKLLILAAIAIVCIACKKSTNDPCEVGDDCLVRDGYHDKGDPKGVLHAYALDTGYTQFWGSPFLRLHDSRDTTWYMEAKGLISITPKP